MTEAEKERMRQIEEIYRRNGTDSFGQWGSVDHHTLYTEPVEPRSRRRCCCGCKRRATHRGMANGLAMMAGCEWSVAKWIRDNHHKEDSKHG